MASGALNNIRTIKTVSVHVTKGSTNSFAIPEFKYRYPYTLILSSDNAGAWRFFGIYYTGNTYSYLKSLDSVGVNVSVSGNIITIQNTNTGWDLDGWLVIV